ncbi:MAG: glycosyltransferase family 2 protein [Kineosporiaceae bacterium]
MAPSDLLDVTVVICSYSPDRWPDLLAAVESVRAQRPRPAEVLVVIDHHHDLLSRAATLDGVRAVPSSRRPGLSGARNTGVQEARSGIVAFLDDDAVAEPGWLGALCAPILDGAAEVVGGRADAVFPSGRPTWFPREFDWVVGCTYRGHPSGRVAIRNPIGCNMAFRADALAQAGPFREDMGRIGARPLGCEETELCIRLVQRVPGARVIHQPAAVVRQRVPASRERVRYFLSRCYAEGLSKAMVARSVGRTEALSSERTYVRRTLPSGVIRGLADAARLRRPDGLARAAAILVGFGATTLGFARGRLARAGPAYGGVE